jgi:hypothetical protein
MASDSKDRVSFTGAHEACEEEKQGSSSTLEQHPVVKRSDPPSPQDEFPEGGKEAWATAFGA